MEEDNAQDIYKYMVSNGVKEKQCQVQVTHKDSTFVGKLCLCGNVLSLANNEAGEVPLIFVLERVTIKKHHDSQASISLGFGDPLEDLHLKFENVPAAEAWMVKIATCSQQMARAELDEMAYKFYTMSAVTSDEAEGSSSFQNYYLSSPYKVVHSFAISQENGLPSRRLVLEECMWESKLSMILPFELVKMYRKWTSEFCYLLESRQVSWPNTVVPALQDVIREVRDNSETYEQCFEFLQNYSGPSFRKSTEKHRVAFGAVPTNLHVQEFGLPKQTPSELFTCGTASAIPLRFQNGGLTRLVQSLDVDPAFMEAAFWCKRSDLLEIKRNIGELSHKLDVEWKIAKFGKPDKVCVELLTGIRQVYERLRDIITSIHNAESCADLLLEEERRRAITDQKVELRVVDSIENQQDSIDAMLISLNTKVAVIDTLNDAQTERSVYEKSARDTMSMCLDMLLNLADSTLEAHLLAFVLSLNEGSSTQAHTYFHISLRTDFVLSQVITIAATAILSRVRKGWPVQNDDVCDPLLVIFSFLSAYGDERGMVEDAWEAWRLLESRVVFKLVRAPSSVCRNCIPIVSGQRTAIQVSLPLPHGDFAALPSALQNGRPISIRTAFFNVGVNHEATLAQSFGGVSLEGSINHDGAQRVLAYSNRMTCGAEAREAVNELVNMVSSEPSRKNLGVFETAMAACETLGGQSVLSCKSGKDRTGMAVTLEQGRALRVTCGLNSAQVSEVVSSLRRDGARRENCKKNVGKAIYSFSPFQMHFLPKSFRPPSGTYAQGVAS